MPVPLSESTRKTFSEIKHAKKRYYSLAGEDGLLEYLLNRLPELNRWCVEFGAWDGKHCSNTFYLIEKKNYRSVLIEGDAERYRQLCQNTREYNAVCINTYVGFVGESTLDKILAKTPIPKDFDLLSIDIDGDDYYVWEAMMAYTPKIVIIEINVRDKPMVDRVNVHGAPYVRGITGTSIKAMTELAARKGYSLVAHVGCNAVYVKNELYQYYYNEPVAPKDVFTYEGHSIAELTKEEFASAKYWGYPNMTVKNRIVQVIPYKLRPYLKKLYRTLF